MAPKAGRLGNPLLAGSVSALVVSTLCLMPGALLAQDPPTNLHLEGDHWTAWNPPEQMPEGAEIYIIQRGDTLWDLAATFLGDPYLWPQIWERNQYILDAHWIYPGDPLVVSVEVVPVGELADTGTAGESGVPEAVPAEPMDERDSMFGRSTLTPSPLGSESDIYCSGFIGPDKQEFPYEVVGSEANALAPSIYGEKRKRNVRTRFGVINTVKNDLATPDIVYLDGGRNGGMSAGSMFTMVEPLDVVRHPLTRNRVGRFYRYLGRLRVLSVQDDTAIAEITDSCHPARIGAKLMPFVAEPVPLGRHTAARPVNLPASNDVLADAPVIVHTDFNYQSLGEGNVVFIDRGEAHEVTPGDIFTIYRMNYEGLPAVVMGELAVLAVHEETSVARILKSRYTVRVGDRLDMK